MKLLLLSLLFVSSTVMAECKDYTVYENGRYRTVQVCSQDKPKSNDGLFNSIANPSNRPRTCKNVFVNGVYSYVCN